MLPADAAAALRFSTPMRATSVISGADDTPSKKAARSRLMNAMLPRLFTAADDLFTHLGSESADDEIWEAEREGFKAAFDAYRPFFVARVSDPFVDPNFVVETMKLQPASPMWHTALRTLLVANLTLLLDDISSMQQQDDPLPLLNAWDSAFPDLFDPDSTKQEAEDFVERALMVRTQLTILTLLKLQAGSHSSFHPREEVAKIWCGGSVSAEAVETFLGDNRDAQDALQLRPLIKGPGAGSDADTLAKDRNMTRFASICKILPSTLIEGPSLDLSQFHGTYPSFEDFVASLRDFVVACFKRVKISLQQSALARDSLVPLAASASEASSRVDAQIRSQLETEAMAHAFDGGESGYVGYFRFVTATLC